MDGVPLRFADTAGVRETEDRIESYGVTRSLETLSDADLALVGARMARSRLMTMTARFSQRRNRFRICL